MRQRFGMDPEPFEQLYQRVWGVPALLWWLALVAVLLASGALSLRFLARAPDFPTKAEMMWGARWFGLLSAAALSVVYALCGLGFVGSDYPMSFFFLGLFSLPLYAMCLPLILPRQADGWSAWITVVKARFGKEALDWAEAAHNAEEKRRRFRRLGVLGLSVLLGMLAFVVLRFTLPADREMGAFRRLDRLEQRVAAQLRSEAIAEVKAGVAPPGSAAAILVVRVAEDTSREEMQAICRQAQSALAAAASEQPWRIIVFSQEGARVSGSYQPAGDANG